MSARIIRIVFDDLGPGPREGLLDFADGNLVRITFLFRVQSETVSARFDKRTQSLKHVPSLLKRVRKCNHQQPQASLWRPGPCHIFNCNGPMPMNTGTSLVDMILYRIYGRLNREVL
jgi:hypothetical protein